MLERRRGGGGSTSALSSRCRLCLNERPAHVGDILRRRRAHPVTRSNTALSCEDSHPVRRVNNTKRPGPAAQVDGCGRSCRMPPVLAEPWHLGLLATPTQDARARGLDAAGVGPRCPRPAPPSCGLGVAVQPDRVRAVPDSGQGLGPSVEVAGAEEVATCRDAGPASGRSSPGNASGSDQPRKASGNSAGSTSATTARVACGIRTHPEGKGVPPGRSWTVPPGGPPRSGEPRSFRGEVSTGPVQAPRRDKSRYSRTVFVSSPSITASVCMASGRVGSRPPREFTPSFHFVSGVVR